MHTLVATEGGGQRGEGMGQNLGAGHVHNSIFNLVVFGVINGEGGRELVK